MRVELGEIESVLSKAPGVSSAAVKVVRHNQTQQDHIIAYTTPKGAAPKPMLAFAQNRLPSHMVPVLVVPMASHPVLPNGKVDMGALPEPDWQLLAQDDAYEAPKTRMEKLVASVWEAVLGIKDAGLQADFFKVLNPLPSLVRMAHHFVTLTRVQMVNCCIVRLCGSAYSCFEPPM